MKKIIGTFLVLISCNVNAAVIKFLCPDNSVMREGGRCYPDVGCFKNGVVLTVGDKSFTADINEAGQINISDEFIGQTFYMKTGDNFWYPSYCDHLSSGYLDSTFKVSAGEQIVPATFHSAFK